MYFQDGLGAPSWLQKGFDFITDAGSQVAAAAWNPQWANALKNIGGSISNLAFGPGAGAAMAPAAAAAASAMPAAAPAAPPPPPPPRPTTQYVPTSRPISPAPRPMPWSPAPPPSAPGYGPHGGETNWLLWGGVGLGAAAILYFALRRPSGRSASGEIAR